MLPFGIELHNMPDDVIAQVPQTKGFQYAVAQNRVLLVSPANRIVVAAISAANDVTIGGGRRSPTPAASTPKP